MADAGSHPTFERLSSDADSAIGRGDYVEAAQLLDAAASAAQAEFGELDERVIDTLETLAHAQYCYIDSWTDAEHTFRRILELREQALGPAHPLLARWWLSLAGAINIGRWQFDEAEHAYHRALELAEDGLEQGVAPPDGTPEDAVATCLQQLAQFYRNHERYAEAEPLLRRLVQMRQQAADPDKPPLRHALGEQAMVLERSGKVAEAIEVYKGILAEREQRASASDFDLGSTQFALARLYAAAGDDREAAAWYARAISAFELATRALEADTGAAQGDGRPVAASLLRVMLVGYASVLRRLGEHEQVAELERRAAELDPGLKRG